MNQKEIRSKVDVGPNIGQVSTAMYWYRAGKFDNDDQARGAFELAHQQAMDGMGASPAAWMGMTEDEYNAWMRDGTLPPVAV